MLRVNIRRCIEFSDPVTTLSEAMKLLRTLSLASIALARLIKTQYFLASGTDPISELINQLLDDLQVELQTNNASNLQSPPASQFSKDTPLPLADPLRSVVQGDLLGFQSAQLFLYQP